MRTLLLLISMMVFALPSSRAQSKTNYEFKRGEVLDVTFFVSRSDINRDSLFGIYRKVLFPIGKEFSFQPIPGFAVKETLQGGHQPSFMALGKWQDVRQRVQFIEEVVRRVPSFHDMRRGLWHTFYLTYYELNSDLKITIDPNKFNVASALWLNKAGRRGRQFIDAWINLCRSNGGKVVLQLDNGASPNGYYYNPDSFLITEWPGQMEYDKFAKKVMDMNNSMIENINEFQI